MAHIQTSTLTDLDMSGNGNEAVNLLEQIYGNVTAEAGRGRDMNDVRIDTNLINKKHHRPEEREHVLTAGKDLALPILLSG